MSFWALPLTPASPATPIARPAAKEDKPQQRPEAKCLKPLYVLYYQVAGFVIDAYGEAWTRRN
jgi:hypothetical protein